MADVAVRREDTWEVWEDNAGEVAATEDYEPPEDLKQIEREGLVDGSDRAKLAMLRLPPSDLRALCESRYFFDFIYRRDEDFRSRYKDEWLVSALVSVPVSVSRFQRMSYFFLLLKTRTMADLRRVYNGAPRVTTSFSQHPMFDMWWRSRTLMGRVVPTAQTTVEGLAASQPPRHVFEVDVHPPPYPVYRGDPTNLVHFTPSGEMIPVTELPPSR